MPLPEPGDKEEKKDFIKRCMGNETTKKEYPDTDQRLAVCNNLWGEAKQNMKANRKLHQITLRINTEEARFTTFQQSEFAVFPVTALREGVWNECLVTAEELAKSTRSWNGRPIVINHPKRGDKFVSANDPNVFEAEQVGYFFNTDFENNTDLVGEVWLNLNRIDQVSEGNDVADSVKEGRPIDVSTGYFALDIKKPGSFKGKPYKRISTNIDPDHLALLPNVKGACSREDGCGTFFEEQSTMSKIKEALTTLQEYVADNLSIPATGKGTIVEENNKINVQMLRCNACGEEHRSIQFELLESGSMWTWRCPNVLSGADNYVVNSLAHNKDLKVNGAELANILNRIIEERVGTFSRSKVVSALAFSAGIGTKDIEKVLAGEIDFPNVNWLFAWSNTLGVDPYFFFDAMDKDIFGDTTREVLEENESETTSVKQIEDSVSNNDSEENTMTRCDLIQAFVDSDQFTEEEIEALHNLPMEELEAKHAELTSSEEQPETNEQEEAETEEELAVNEDPVTEEPEEEPEVNTETEENEEPEVNEKVEEEPVEPTAFADDLGFSDEEAKKILKAHRDKINVQRKKAVEFICNATGLEEADISQFTNEQLVKMVATISERLPQADYSGQAPVVFDRDAGEDDNSVPAPPKVFPDNYWDNNN